MQREALEYEPTHQPFDQRERLYYDTATWGAELLDGSMRTTFEYSFDGNELYASDGSSMRTVFEDAVEDADKLAESNPSLGFEKRRRLIELDEYEEMVAMASGEGPNTMVVISEYPSELIGSKEDVGGYNHQRMQTMMRIISRTDEGKIRITSQSLDKSDRDGLESIYSFLGQEPEQGELLGQRTRAEVEEDRQQLLADEFTREYDRTLEHKFGHKYYAGRTPAEIENTYDFVIRQYDLLEAFMLNPTDDNKYAFAAALDRRWKTDKNFVPGQSTSRLGSVVALGMAQEEMQVQALFARQENKTFSGCGVTLGAGSLEPELDALGYGNKYGSDQYGSLQFNCPNGHSNIRPHGKLIDCCKTCGTDVKC